MTNVLCISEGTCRSDSIISKDCEAKYGVQFKANKKCLQPEDAQRVVGHDVVGALAACSLHENVLSQSYFLALNFTNSNFSCYRKRDPRVRFGADDQRCAVS